MSLDLMVWLSKNQNLILLEFYEGFWGFEHLSHKLGQGHLGIFS